jgi:hypothetical protein
MEDQKKNLIPINTKTIHDCGFKGCPAIGFYRASIRVTGGVLETDLYACSYHVRNDPGLLREYMNRPSVQKELARQIEPYGLTLQDILPAGIKTMTIQWREAAVFKTVAN